MKATQMEISRENVGLVVRGATKIYEGTNALVDVDLTVRPGEVVALLGENGAGKSTLASIIAGVTPATSGTMNWNGEPYSPANPGDAIANGIGLVHQEMRLLPDLTVAENVMLGRWPTTGGWVNRQEMVNKAQGQLTRLGFTGSPNQLVRELSVAGQQQVEIAKALMMNARLLILDEPTAALGQSETNALFDCVRSLRAEGVSFVYVSHRLAEIAAIATHIVVLRDGREVASYDNGQVSPDELVEDMVGRPIDRLFPDIGAPTEDVTLEVLNLSSAENRFGNISFSVRAGEIFGIAGIVGAGRTELVRAIAGADRVSAGQVLVDGKPIRSGSPTAAIDAGLVLIPEDRKRQGLIADMTIQDNVALANFDHLLRGGFIGKARVARLATKVSAKFGVKGRPSDSVSSLSGGNQQKVVIAKWLDRKPRVVILDEPTRGIDVGARSAIYEIIAQLAAHGTAIVVVSSDLDEVLGLSHRVMALSRGVSKGIVIREDATAKSIMALAVS
jgi:ribose transport system ATP-binding protein